MMLAAGAVFLVLAPFGVGPAQPGLVAWVLFPALTIVGYLMVVFAARDTSIPLITRFAGAALIALAVGATVGLFLAGNALVQPVGTTFSLWYVVAVGFVLGIGGSQSAAPGPTEPGARRRAHPGRAVRDTLLELVLLLGPAIAVALAGTVLAYREAQRRGAPLGELVVGALGAVLRWGLIGCGVLAAAVIALKVAAANDQAPRALVAAPWVFALGGTFGLWRWLAVRTAQR